MKSNLSISGLLFSIVFLTFSCTNDDFEAPTYRSNQSTAITTEQLKSLNENMNGKVEDSIYTSPIPEVNNITDGDPIIPRPPRKD